MLKSATHPGWFEIATGDLGSLLSDHLHCERKAAESALSLLRRSNADPEATLALGRLAHEETSHIIQVSELMSDRGLLPRPDRPNLYARGLLALLRPGERHHRADALLVASLIEARSHERLGLLASGYRRRGEERLAGFFQTLCNAEERHAEIYQEIAARCLPPGETRQRLEELALAEAEILAALPWQSRIH